MSRDTVCPFCEYDVMMSEAEAQVYHDLKADARRYRFIRDRLRGHWMDVMSALMRGGLDTTIDTLLEIAPERVGGVEQPESKTSQVEIVSLDPGELEQLRANDRRYRFLIRDAEQIVTRDRVGRLVHYFYFNAGSVDELTDQIDAELAKEGE